MHKQDDEESQLLFEQLWEPLPEIPSSIELKEGPPPPKKIDLPKNQKIKFRQNRFSHFLLPIMFDFPTRLNHLKLWSDQFQRWDTRFAIPKIRDKK